MIDWLVYGLTGGFAGVIFAFVVAMFKVGPGKPEFPFFKWAAVSVILVLSAPFGFVEFNTRQYRAEFDKQIDQWYLNTDYISDSGAGSGIDYWKVLLKTDRKAIVLVIGKEKESWGGFDRPIVRLNWLKDGKGKWQIDSDRVEVLRSARLDKDEIVWPPYQ